MSASVRTPKVLFFDLDGVRRDKLRQACTPNLDRLAAGGQLGSALTHDPDTNGVATVSGPLHSTIVTGVWPDKHQVTDNLIEPNNLARHPDFLTRLASERPELSTFAVGDWPPLINQIIDAPGTKILHAGDTADTTRQTVAWAQAAVTERDPDVGFVYFLHVDTVGHRHGGASPEYLTAIEEVDRAVGAIVQAVRSRPAYGEEEWLFLATTDHGHTDQGYPNPGHGGSEPEVRQIWTLASGAGIPAAPPGGEARLVDLVPTVLAHLGVDIDPAWELDGSPLI